MFLKISNIFIILSKINDIVEQQITLIHSGEVNSIYITLEKF